MENWRETDNGHGRTRFSRTRNNVGTYAGHSHGAARRAGIIGCVQREPTEPAAATSDEQNDVDALESNTWTLRVLKKCATHVSFERDRRRAMSDSFPRDRRRRNAIDDVGNGQETARRSLDSAPAAVWDITRVHVNNECQLP